jgi:IS5 family transposase
VVDTTVQEKNITYPTDSKLCRKIIQRCWKLADKNKVRLRRRYRKLVRKYVMAQRHRRDRKHRKLAQRALRKMKIIAGRLLRELERKLPVKIKEAEQEHFQLYRRVLRQQVGDHEKIYSLHEPQVYCLAKGKEHKKYEFGSKASIVITKESGVIVGALAHEKNLYDGDTLPVVLRQSQNIRGREATRAIVDRGYRGRKQVGTTEVLVPGRAREGQSRSVTARLRHCFRRRAAIEPVIGHLKGQYRLGRSYLKGIAGDNVNVMLAAAAWNLRKWMRELVLFWLQLLRHLLSPESFRPFTTHA